MEGLKLKHGNPSQLPSGKRLDRPQVLEQQYAFEKAIKKKVVALSSFKASKV